MNYARITRGLADAGDHDPAGPGWPHAARGCGAAVLLEVAEGAAAAVRALLMTAPVPFPGALRALDEVAVSAGPAADDLRLGRCLGPGSGSRGRACGLRVTGRALALA